MSSLLAPDITNGSARDLAAVLADFARIAVYDHSECAPGLGSLFHFDPASALGQDQQFLARAYGVAHAWPSTNGTTCLNTLAVLAVCQPGDTILVQRDAHLSVLAPLVHLGLRPRYLMPAYDSTHGIYLGPNADDLAQTLAQHPEIRAVFLTYPSYFGIAADIVACARACLARGIPLIIDAAHGAYFPFHPAFPLAAGSTGAAIVTHSLHKTCSALGQASLALLTTEAVVDPFYRAVGALGFVSTSFSYLLVQSLVLGVQQLVRHGHTLLEHAWTVSCWLREAINRIDGLTCFSEDDLAQTATAGRLRLDPLRLTVDVSGLGLTGYAVQGRLIRDFHIYPELATITQILLLLTPTDDWDTAQGLLGALQQIAHSTAWGSRPAVRAVQPPDQLPCPLLTPRDAYYAPRRRVPWRDAIGLPAAETVTTFPPGSPLVVVGEEVTAEVVAFAEEIQAHGAHLKGLADPSAQTLAVVDWTAARHAQSRRE